MDINSKIHQLRKLIEDEIFLHAGRHVHENQIQSLILEINNDCAANYETQRKFVSQILDLYEKYHDHFFPLLYFTFLSGFQNLKKMRIRPLDMSSWDKELSDEMYDSYETLFKTSIQYGKQIRLSEETVCELSAEDGENYLTIIYRMLISTAVNPSLSVDDIESIMTQLWMARSIAIAIRREEVLYYMILTFFDSLNFNQNFQIARDLAEECLICSYKDKIPEYGYYIAFKVNAGTSNAMSALHYAGIAQILFFKKSEISDYLIKNFFWEGIKFSRNVGIPHYSRVLFEDRPTNVNYTEYDLGRFHHALYSSMIIEKDILAPNLIVTYLDKQKEKIISNGEKEILPWLSLLLVVKKNYDNNDYEVTQLEQYLALCERIVSPVTFKRLHNSLFGVGEDLILELKTHLVKLSYTRSQSDFITDNKAALQVSHINLSESFKQENPIGYLLSMILQSDFSIVFKDKHSNHLSRIKEDFASKIFEDEYYTPEFLFDFINELKGSILWVGADNHNVYPLFFNGKQFEFKKGRETSLHNIYEISKLTPFLPLNTQSDGVLQMTKSYQDYELEEKAMISRLSTIDFQISPQNCLLLVKDIKISSLPHNLLLSFGRLLCKDFAISNIMSLEWFLENYHYELPSNFSTAMWIPTDSGDFAVCLIHSRLEDLIKQYQISEYTNLLPHSPLTSNVNILVAHGNENINTFPAFYLQNGSNTFSIKSLWHIVGNGDILVLFVCHSGSEKSDLFRNQTLTIIKEFLQNGYKTVIAPFWSLHIDIPPIWLPEFLSGLKAGRTVGESFILATKKVAEVFNTPNAYACLHLYGNPYLKRSVEKN